MAAGDLYDAAAELLASVVASLGATAPSIQYVSTGMPVYECDQVTVHAEPLADAGTSPSAQPLDSYQNIPRMNIVTLTVTVLRCWPEVGPGGGPPSGAQMDAASQTTYADAWTIRNAIRHAHQSGALYPQRDMEVGVGAAIAPMGGVAGWTQSVNVRLDGYTP